MIEMVFALLLLQDHKIIEHQIQVIMIMMNKILVLLLENI